MDALQTEIAGLIVLRVDPVRDARGEFTRIFCAEELATVLAHRRVAQINQSLTHVRGTIRGLHYQLPPGAEMKFVRCLRGKVWDVVVDLRKNSPTFLHWHAEELSPNQQKILVVPEGCAHGFQVLEDESEILYLHTAPYAANLQSGIRYNDPVLAIPWPLPPTIISDRDRILPSVDQAFEGLEG